MYQKPSSIALRGPFSDDYRFCCNRRSFEKFTPWFPSQDNVLLFSFLI